MTLIPRHKGSQMVRFPRVLMSVLGVGSLLAIPSAAQTGTGTSSLTHVVSVTIAPRVKVRVSALSLSPRNVHAAVRVTAADAATSGLALTVHANQAWVLAIKSAPNVEASPRTMLLWSNSPTGRFTPISSADSPLVSGTGSAAPVDTTVVFRDPSQRRSVTAEQAVVLTVTAP